MALPLLVGISAQGSIKRTAKLRALIGADERTGEILGSFFSEGLPPGACLQVLHLQERNSEVAEEEQWDLEDQKLK